MIIMNLGVMGIFFVVGALYGFFGPSDAKPEAAMACCLPDSRDEACVRGRMLLERQAAARSGPAVR